MKSYRQARIHYVRHGKPEGRFPNLESYVQNADFVVTDLKAKFDPVAYRFYNKDVGNRYKTDAELFGHYVRHGHKEGRLSRFPEDGMPTEALPNAEKWKSIFSIADYIAWCGNELPSLPENRQEALDSFCALGIDRLWPINLEYIFEVDFVRSDGLLARKGTDAELYHSWLCEGFPAGIAPNEQLFLASHLDGAPFPSRFDWQGFVRKSRLPSATTRSVALIALFELPSPKIIGYADLMGEDAAWLFSRIGHWALARGAFPKAAALLEQALVLHPTAGGFCALGDAQRSLRAPLQALDAYLAATDMPQAPMSAFLEAATLHAAHKAFPEAFAILRKGYPAWRQKAAFGTALHEIIRLYFEHQSARAHGLYRDGVEQDCTATRTSADSLLVDTLNLIRTAYGEMDAVPAPTGGDPEGYVAILANDDLRQCTHYRIEQKVLQFERAGIEVRLFSHTDAQGFLDSLIGARAAIFYRVAAIPAILRAIVHANGMGLVTYYEIDDLIFDPAHYPDPFPSFEGQISATDYAGLQFGVPLFRYAMTMCKRYIASTPALLERMRGASTDRAGIVIRNGLDHRNDAAIIIGAHPVRPSGERLRIFYGSGTKAHNADFNRLAGQALLDLMQRHDHVDLVIVGHLKLRPEFDALQDRISIYPVITDITVYWSILASCHINLAVLEAGAVADCKSEIKWLEAAIVQVPSIVSATKTYCEALEDGQTVFIARSAEGWRTALEQLVTQTQLRDRLSSNARAKALHDYSLDVGVQQLSSEFSAAHLEPSASLVRSQRLRVLICNVFFAPQSYGGATRVVEDNVRDFATRYPDLDIAIFCSDEGAVPAGRLRMDAEDAIPVYRLSIPQDSRIDWTPFNDDHAAPFKRVLDHFRPDLIHFHCIQRLTATIVEVALQRAMPYVVTLHDAWWISDDQFLLGKDGLQLPTTDLLGDCAGSTTPLASIARRQCLASLLRQADARLSVSRPFADIYADAGIPEVSVVENGTPSVSRGVPLSRGDGRVAIGHIGGRSVHKGASLIEATLRRGRYDNLHLTMVDGTLQPGQSVDTIWGTTPVTLTASYPASRIADLYRRLNVLLAPSIWPESFGLVAREALGHGLWVIASNLGAIAQDIEDGHNGHVLDVSTARDLSETLSRIDADPAKYRAPPPDGRRVLRSMMDQATELHHLYHSMAARISNA